MRRLQVYCVTDRTRTASFAYVIVRDLRSRIMKTAFDNIQSQRQIFQGHISNKTR